MQEQLTNRLKELKAEFEAGQKKLAEVEGQASDLRTTMLRISGAIQVLEEELAKASGATPDSNTFRTDARALQRQATVDLPNK
jgi:predicted  nucleic acid-binding Zn-ribbon protein